MDIMNDDRNQIFYHWIDVLFNAQVLIEPKAKNEWKENKRNIWRNWLTDWLTYPLNDISTDSC